MFGEQLREHLAVGLGRIEVEQGQGQGQFLPPARDFYLDCLCTLQGQGAEAAILGCTEIGLLLDGQDAPLPLLDSAELHMAMGLEWLLGASLGGG